MNFRILFFLLLAFFTTLSQASNRLFDEKTGKFAGRPMSKGVSAVIENDSVNLTLDGGKANWVVDIPISAATICVRVRTKMRLTDVGQGEQSWENARLAMRFYDAKGKPVGEWPDVIGASGTRDWTEYDRVYSVPKGAASLQFAPSNFSSKGKAEFFNLKVESFEVNENVDMDEPAPNNFKQEDLFSISDAWRQTTPTRERISLNGLWGFRPVFPDENVSKIPAKGSGWGFFKVPGGWPSSSMKMHLSPFALAKFKVDSLNSAWYRRTIEVPKDWAGRTIFLTADMIQSCAKVFVDGKDAGEFYYPGGELDLTGKLQAGKTHSIVILVSAKPEVTSSYNAPDRLITQKAELPNRGITADLFLESRPAHSAISDVQVITSVANKEISFDVGFSNQSAPKGYFQAEILKNEKIEKTIKSEQFSQKDFQDGRFKFSGKWENPLLWDTDTPQNLYTLRLSLFDENSKLVDEFIPQEFGFREFSINGRDFYLNGKKIHLRMLVSKAPQTPNNGSDIWIKHLNKVAKEFGANFIIGWNYSFAPGIFAYPDGFHKGTSAEGILTSLTLPHVKDFKTNLNDSAQEKEYRRQSEHLIRRYQNVPGVIMYVMNHNAMGYNGDQNPSFLGTEYSPEKVLPSDSGALKNRKQAKIAENIAKSIDSSRPVYHHESGNLGDVYTINCYLNWAPRQERSDWLEQWNKNGTRPVVFVEWGLPHVASWSSFRGPEFIWRFEAHQCLWFNEFNAAILGEDAYKTQDVKEIIYEKEKGLISKNRPVHFGRLGANGQFNNIDDVNKVRGWYSLRNVRDLRWAGASGFLPWDQSTLWRNVVSEPSRDNPQRYQSLKSPGVVPDRLISGGEYLGNPFGKYTYTETGKPFAANFGKYLAWIAGKTDENSENGHNFSSGETVLKSIAILNDSRQNTTAKWSWSVPNLNLKHNGEVQIEAGSKVSIPVEFKIPTDTQGKFEIQASVVFSEGNTFEDSFEVSIVNNSKIQLKSKVGLFDPEGKSAKLLEQLGVDFKIVKTDDDIEGLDLLILGRNSLDNFPLNLRNKLKNGLKLFVLEQSAQTLDRIGLRCTEHGYREVFEVGKSNGNILRDWRGASTQIKPYFDTPAYESHMPIQKWSGFDNSRVWHAGNRGTVTDVPIEKPQIGNWTPLLQCGFDLQYSPMLEFTEGRGHITFCQLAITDRTENEPEALQQLSNALTRLDNATYQKRKPVYYLGGKEGKKLLKNLKVQYKTLKKDMDLPPNALLVVDSSAKPRDFSKAIEEGANILVLGVSKDVLSALIPNRFNLKSGKYASDKIDGLAEEPLLKGVSNAELHWRWAKEFDAFSDSKTGKSLAVRKIGQGNLVVFQLPPWKFDSEEFSERTTRRRTTFLVSKLLANMGAKFDSDFFDLFDGIKGNARFDMPNDNWKGLADSQKKGRDDNWWKIDYQLDANWRPIRVGSNFDLQYQDLNSFNGWFWYRLEFDLPKNFDEIAAQLYLGAIDDESWVWFNDKFLGEVSSKTTTKHWEFKRTYDLPAGSFKEGKNVLVVLCNDSAGYGGILGRPFFKFETKNSFYTDIPNKSDDPYRYYRW